MCRQEGAQKGPVSVEAAFGRQLAMINLLVSFAEVALAGRGDHGTDRVLPSCSARHTHASTWTDVFLDFGGGCVLRNALSRSDIGLSIHMGA